MMRFELEPARYRAAWGSGMLGVDRFHSVRQPKNDQINLMESKIKRVAFLLMKLLRSGRNMAHSAGCLCAAADHARGRDLRVNVGNVIGKMG
jgi:hypothetical protein